MKIALIGYGKMGKEIEALALQNGYEVLLKISSKNLEELTIENLKKCDVAIEFTQANSALQHIKICIAAQVPVVCGSTGWLQHWPQLMAYIAQQKGTFLYASNFSIGVQLFFALNKKLAALMAPHSQYKVSLTEVHHTQKKDAPSGTAISLAEGVLAEIPRYKNWINAVSQQSETIGISSLREDPAPGTHQVLYSSEVDDIEIVHTAHNRKGFAQGALMAANFIKNKTGVFTMNDVLQL